MKLKKISKQYGKKTVLKEINTEIGYGIYGLLGANGAGKSTLMKIMIGEVKESSGKIIYENENNSQERFFSTLGYLPQNFRAPKEMKVFDYLRYVAVYKGIKDEKIKANIQELCQDLNLSDYIQNRIGDLSGGTLQRVGIAQAFLGNPSFIILDEPSSGLDISERRNLKEFISRKSRDKSIIISTHIISDIEYIVDHLLIIKAGRILQDISYKEAIKSLDGCVWEDYLNNEQITHGEKLIQSMGGVTTNLDREDNSRNHIRYVGKEKLTNNSVYKEPELNDFYLWTIEGGR